MPAKKIIPVDFKNIKPPIVVLHLAKQYGVDRRVIIRWLYEIGLKPPSTKEAMRTIRCISIPMNKKLMSVFDGLMLSDGFLSYRKKNNDTYTANFELGTPFVEYANCVAQTLTNLGLPSWVLKHKQSIGPWNSDPNKPDYRVYSKRTIELGEQVRRWYIERKPKNVKIVPNDIANDACMWIWEYVGDGTTCRTNKYSNAIRFSTCAFEEKEVDFLVERLYLNGIESCRYDTEDGPVIQINRNGEVKKFLNFIGVPPCEFFRYKWNINARPQQYCINCNAQIGSERSRIYCSERCQYIYRTKNIPISSEISCVVCTLLFKPKTRLSSYCSKACKRKLYETTKNLNRI